MLVEGLPPLSPRLRARQPERFPAEVERHFRLVRRALSLHRTFLQVSADDCALARRVASGGWLSTYSAATRVRSSLARAGLKVGRGPRVGQKDEGTLASPTEDPPPLAPRTARRSSRWVTVYMT